MNTKTSIDTNINKPQQHLHLAYILICTVLFLPVLLWPIPILISGNPMLADMLTPTWLLCIAMMLLVSVSMDSMLYSISSFKQAMIATLWVSLIAIWIVSTLQKKDDIWILAILFLLHSLRSAIHLIKEDKDENLWWWMAWSRDITSAIVIFFWSSHLSPT